MTLLIDADMLDQACAISDRIMRGVMPEQLADPTPCADWTVEELMQHMVASTDFFADAAEFGSVPDDREWPDYASQELVTAHRRHLERLMAAYRNPGVMTRPMTILAGPSTAEFCLQIAISERFVHAWDLAAATNQPFGTDGNEIARALLASSEYLAVNAEVRESATPPFGPELSVESGGPVEKLVAYLGRDPSQAAT